jgi:hypothetical protein
VWSLVRVYIPPPPPAPRPPRKPPQERSLDPAVTLPVYASHAAAATGGSAAGEMFLGAGERAALWLGAPPDDKLPKDAKEGGWPFLNSVSFRFSI